MTSQGHSIRQQLQFIVVTTTLVALSFALLGNSAINILAFRTVQAQDLSAQADLLGRMTSPAIIFEDHGLARENLAYFEVRKQVRAVAIYGVDGQLFASYTSPDNGARLPSKPGRPGMTRAHGDLEMFHPIVRDGTSLGTLYLRADEGLSALIGRQLGVAALVGMLALVIALLLVRRLERIVTGPISAISAAARDVVAQGDFSRRVAGGSKDELGEMIDAFNDMLMQIGRGQEQLEARVSERTAELEESNRQLALTKIQAEEANRAKSIFLASMSHEIRTPMNGVIGMVDVLHQTSLTGQQVEMVDLVRESAFSLLTVIDDILDFSKIEADRLDVEQVPIWLAEVVEKACGLMDSLAMRHNVEFLTFVDPRLPDLLLGDALRLRQILVNLINNAIKFSGGRENAGRVSVRALLVEHTATDAEFTIAVTDNGIGIDADTRSRLFRAFSQADTSTTRRFGGTGLGLVISRRLVELMGGTISVESELGVGSTFSVRLRLPLAPGATAAPGSLVQLSGVRCVVIGPENGIAGDLAQYLEHASASVVRAPTLDAAIELGLAQALGQWIWVIDGGQSPPGLASLRSVAHELPGCDVHFVVLGRGTRREPLLPHPDLVELDGNVLTRRRLVRAVALSAGLELEDAERYLPGQPRSISKAPSRDQARRDGRLILIAEDNETNQKVILRQLSLLGYAADVASNGAEALERWKTGDYVLLLTDLHMPKMDGYELTAAIRADESDGGKAPIIALTANALKGEADRCRDAGMNNYLSKPLQLADLKAALQEWLPEENTAHLPVDIRVLEHLVGNDPDVVRGFLVEFRDSLGQIAALIETACAGSNTDVAGAHAHKLKASARTVGALRLAALCEHLENIAHGVGSESLAEVWVSFATELRAVNDFLDHLPHQLAREE